MLGRFKRTVVLTLCCGIYAAVAGAAASRLTTAPAKWETYTDKQRHFSFDHPPSWKVCADVTLVAHYTQVFAAGNSLGRDGLVVKELPTGPGEWSLTEKELLQQVPSGAAYIDVSWIEGPGGMDRFGPKVVEMEAADLSSVLKGSEENVSADLIARELHFHKWAKDWQVQVYMHRPVTEELRTEVKDVLQSFRFHGVPAGDEEWAAGLAVKYLPAEADPDKYMSLGGSDQYYCEAKADGDVVTVSFTKHKPDTAAQRWTYRVAADGKVTPIEPK